MKYKSVALAGALAALNGAGTVGCSEYGPCEGMENCEQIIEASEQKLIDSNIAKTLSSVERCLNVVKNGKRSSVKVGINKGLPSWQVSYTGDLRNHDGDEANAKCTCKVDPAEGDLLPRQSTTTCSITYKQKGMAITDSVISKPDSWVALESKQNDGGEGWSSDLPGAYTPHGPTGNKKDEGNSFTKMAIQEKGTKINEELTTLMSEG